MEAKQRYDKSPAGKAKRATWLASPAGKASNARRTERYWRKRLGLTVEGDEVGYDPAPDVRRVSVAIGSNIVDLELTDGGFIVRYPAGADVRPIPAPEQGCPCVVELDPGELEYDPPEGTRRVTVGLGVFDVAIKLTDEGIIDDVFPRHAGTADPIASTGAHNSDAKEEL